MAFDGHQRTFTFANSPFQTYQRQTDGVNGVPFPSNSSPAPSHQQHDNRSILPWSHNTQDDPFALISCAQTSIKSRKPTDSADSNCDADLQDLVSNILDEGHSRESSYTESVQTCKPIWSSMTPREELLQYLHTGAKMLHSPSFPSYQLSQETSSKTHEPSVDRGIDETNQESICQAANQQWLINLPNGDNYSFHPQKLPPGLPIPNAVNTDPSQTQLSKYTSFPVYNDRGNDQRMNNNDIFRPQNKTNSSCFDAFSEDQYLQRSVNPVPGEERVQEDMNQLVSSFQSVMGCELDSVCLGEFPNMHKQTEGMHKEDGIAEQYKITSPVMSMPSIPTMQIPKQLLGNMEAVQMGRQGGGKKQTFKLGDFQDLSDFHSHHVEYFQPTKEFSTPLKNANQHPTRMTINRENVNLSKNHHLKHRLQQSQMQKSIKPQMQKEKKRMPMPGFLEDSFPRKQQNSSHVSEGDKQALSQNPYFDFWRTMQSQRHDGQNYMLSAGNMQQYTSLMYPVNDLRRNSIMPVASNFSPSTPLSHGNGVPGIHLGGMMSANEAAALNYCLSDMRSPREDNTFHGTTSALTSSLMMNQGRPTMQLYFYLDECHKQWRCLEMERKKTDMILRKTFPGKKITDESNTNLQKTSSNATRVDHLALNQMKEQAKVADLLDIMERLCGVPLHIKIHTALRRHHAAVCIMQERCKEYCVNMTKHHQQGMNFTEDRDILLMVMALSDLAATTRRLRTALWCALQMLLPKPVEMQDHHDFKEASCTQRCSSPFQFYSFHL